MLLALSLHDFVLVKQLHLNFEHGFTVLTGETGAGKSVTLDALALLLGGKADFGQIRHGAPEARLSALFDLSALPELQTELREQGWLPEDGSELSLRRIIDAKGRSRSFINDQAATLAQLKQLGSRLIDIHGQNAHHSLAQEAAQRQRLDAFSGSLKLAAQTQERYRLWRQAQQTLAEAHNRAEMLAAERERLQWQFDELERLATYEGEWEAVSRSHDSLAHAAELLQAAGQAAEYLGGTGGITELLHRCRKLLQPLSAIEPRFADSLNMLESVEAELGEIRHNVDEVAARVEINPAELAEREARMAALMSAARKYRIEPQQLPDKLAQTARALQDSEAAADIPALTRRVAEAEADYLESARQLSARRQQAAAQLAAETTAQMQGLAMQGARFHIELLPCEAAAHGLEQVQYQVAMNPGGPLRPLGKVASGGELARISLALQVVSGAHNQMPTLIFDEVDTGIGGSAAEAVGRALRSLGRHHQVLAVTHLPQVAACGGQHWQVVKYRHQGNTFSKIQVLDTNGRVEEIARMLGGETVSDTSRRHAEAMLASAS